MSRYLVDVETDKVLIVDDNDDAKFYAALTERTEDGRQKYEQTGPQDPRVTEITLPGEDHGTGSRFDLAGLGEDDVRGGAPAPFTALGEQEMKPSELTGSKSSKSTTKSS